MSNDSPNTFVKDPSAVLDYSVDWEDWLNDDTISASTWTVASGITKDSDSFSDTVATAWMSGGTSGQTYALVNRIVTAAGRTDERTIYITVRDK